MSDLASEITEFLRGERTAMDRGRLVAYMVVEATANINWSDATYAQWEIAIDEAIKRGLILADGVMVRVAPKAQVEKPEQLELF